VGRVNDPTRDRTDRQLRLLTWKEVASIQAQAAMPKEVNDLCSLGTIWLVRCSTLARYVGGPNRDAGVKRPVVQTVPVSIPRSPMDDTLSIQHLTETGHEL
jgi:hypothetical protein